MNQLEQNNQLEILTKEIPREVSHEIVNNKINVEDILCYKNIDLVRNHFKMLGVENYYDFKYFSVKEFKQILKDNPNIKELFIKVIWRENYSKLRWRWISDAISMFARRIGFDRLKKAEIITIMKEDLKQLWIKNYNEYRVLVLARFKRQYEKNSLFKYYCTEIFNESLVDLTKEQYLELWKKLWLELLDEQEQKIELRNIMLKYGVEYIEYINKITVRNFRKIFEENLLVKDYFISKWIEKSSIEKKEIIEFWTNIWLISNKPEIKDYIKEFLQKHWIKTYEDLYDWWVNYSRSLLWNDSVCKEILQCLWVKNLKDYRVEHIKKFARYIWLEWIPNNIEYKEENAVGKITNILKQNNVDCQYSLELLWIKWFKKIFNKTNISSEIVYEEISSFMKVNIKKVIPKLDSWDLKTIGIKIWLPKLTEEQHKLAVLNILEKDSLTLKTLTVNKVKTKYWKNKHFRYFLSHKYWVTDVKKVSSKYIEELRVDLG